MSDSTRSVRIRRLDGETLDDLVAVEEPLEIRIGLELRGARVQKSISITMRTPGQDTELAAGFLVGEGILRDRAQIAEIRHCGSPVEGRDNPNVVRVELADGVTADLARLQRNFYTTSSCGVCGKSSLEALAVTGYEPIVADWTVASELVTALPGKLRERQETFEKTGGLHAAALFSLDGTLESVREDVGRHNALDKLIGAAFLEDRLPLQNRILLLSGRASFELLQKALVARIPVVAAVGAPSSLAVDLARSFGITLLGFVRDGRFNCYSEPARISEQG